MSLLAGVIQRGNKSARKFETEYGGDSNHHGNRDIETIAASSPFALMLL